MDTKHELLGYYEAIEQASVDMLAAARAGNWEEVARLVGVCTHLIKQLKAAARNTTPLSSTDTKTKNHIMQRILINDAEIHLLADPWLEQILSGTSPRLH